MGKLTALRVKSERRPGRHADGGGLVLHIRESGSRAWVLRLQVDGHRRDFGLGSADDVSLATARERAEDMRRQLRAGIDPVAERKAARAERSGVPTFREAAKALHSDMRGGWRNPKHAAQWLSTLETYVFPKLGDLPVDRIEGPLIHDVLMPIWQIKEETARRVRQRVGAVLDWSYARGFRKTEAPMRSVSKGLPRQTRPVRHHAAVHYDDGPSLVAKLQAGGSVGRDALLFLAFTLARSGETRNATWREISFAERLWRIPASRMKAKVEHVIPLSSDAVGILERLKAAHGAAPDKPLFPGLRGQPLSDATLLKVLRTATGTRDTVHGLRSTFRDWAADKAPHFRREAVEKALAHTNPDRVEASYCRTLYLDERPELMQAWANFLLGRKTPQRGRRTRR